MRVKRATDATPLVPGVLSGEHRFIIARKSSAYFNATYKAENTIFKKK